MTATMQSNPVNGRVNGHSYELIERLNKLDEDYRSAAKERDAQSSYLAGDSGRMNPVPPGINPLGTDADYHYKTARNYFLMVERGRAAVRNHPLVEQGINRLIANLKLGEVTLDVDSGDKAVDQDQKDDWRAWTEDPKACDYEQARTFQQMSRQSFFSQVTDGDILHIPIVDGSLQTWESHHIRSPWGARPTGNDTYGMVHGAEVRDRKTVAYWVTPQLLTAGQSLSRTSQVRRFPVYDENGNKIAFWKGFTHRWMQRRGISRLSPPRDAMNGFDDLNYANIKSSLRRALISFLMTNKQDPGPALPGGAAVPQAGPRYREWSDAGEGLKTAIVEMCGEPAQVFKPPPGYELDGWNANLPVPAFFEHSALMLTMLAVNLDLPLMFLLLDGSLVNFHGGRMTFDQAKLRFIQLQQDEIDSLYKPTYAWRTRSRLNPSSPLFDPKLAAAVERGANPFKFCFRKPTWPYVKPLEDAAGEDLAERRNLRSLKRILANNGIDEDEHVEEVIVGRGKWARRAILEAMAIAKEYPDAQIDVPRFFRELWYGNEITGATLAISADDSGVKATATDGQPSKSNGGNRA